MNWPLRFWNYVKTWREHRRVIKELNQLSDDQLRDIGLSRGDINRLIWLETDRHRSGGFTRDWRPKESETCEHCPDCSSQLYKAGTTLYCACGYSQKETK